MLELCPQLTDLSIEMSDREGTHFTYDFLRALLPHPSDQSQSLLLPKLESLVITEWQKHAIDSQTASSLFDMIEARAMSLSTPWNIQLQFRDERESVVEMKKALEVRGQKLRDIGTTCHIAG
ncbi:hypothetical protein MPER_00153 [Moniliophthora perniciosa FA553]|nr:hypothetical protein MPER_00153 [Moniliophthora perniciosa FA553]